MKTLFKVMFLAVPLVLVQAYAAEVVLIGNNNVPKMDAVTIQKVYTGKIVTVAGISVLPISAKPGTSERNTFLQEFLNLDEDKYTAYWTVRRYVGKGAPPPELANDADVIQYVQSTPGAVGYISEANLKPGINTVGRKSSINKGVPQSWLDWLYNREDAVEARIIGYDNFALLAFQ